MNYKVVMAQLMALTMSLLAQLIRTLVLAGIGILVWIMVLMEDFILNTLRRSLKESRIPLLMLTTIFRAGRYSSARGN